MVMPTLKMSLPKVASLREVSIKTIMCHHAFADRNGLV
jgi:hypothetical protein